MSESESKKLPFTAEFSPTIIDLEWILAAASKASGQAQLKESIYRTYFKGRSKSGASKSGVDSEKVLAYNVVLAAAAYGLLDRTSGALTDLGKKLQAASDVDRYDMLAKHILLNLGGLDLLRCIRSIQDRAERPSKALIAKELEQMGYVLTVNATAPAKMRLWLEKAGVISKDFEIDDAKVANLSGFTVTDADEFASLTNEQKLFLRATTTVAGVSFTQSSAIRKYVKNVYNVQLTESNLNSKVVEPLIALGFIEQEGTSTGRGAKSGRVRVPSRLVEVDLDRLFSGGKFVAPKRLRSFLRKPFSEVLADLKSANTNIKGLALEALAVTIARFLSLEPTEWRKMSSATGGAEVDLIAEGAHLVFSRWQIQCKNSKTVHVDDLAKEQGLAQLLRSNVILLATTGTFSGPVLTYAKRIMEDTNLSVVLLDKTVLSSISRGGDGMMPIFTACEKQAQMALKLKASQLSALEEPG